ncbi:MAG: hypothetical protein FWD24_02260 [Treponema sp.]|nr:hypothetical protein [Treponema sp.]
MVVLEHFIINQVKIERLQFSFSKLTETNQHYVIGLVEGLKHAQVNRKEKQILKMPDNAKSVTTAFYKY